MNGHQAVGELPEYAKIFARINVKNQRGVAVYNALKAEDLSAVQKLWFCRQCTGKLDPGELNMKTNLSLKKFSNRYTFHQGTVSRWIIKFNAGEKLEDGPGRPPAIDRIGLLNVLAAVQKGTSAKKNGKKDKLRRQTGHDIYQLLGEEKKQTKLRRGHDFDPREVQQLSLNTFKKYKKVRCILQCGAYIVFTILITKCFPVSFSLFI